MVKQKKRKLTLGKIDNYVYFNLKEGLKYIKESRNYFYIILALFFITVFIGYFFPSLFQDQIIKIISELIEQTKDLGTFELIAFIINNNLKSSFFGMALGIFFGIAPIIVTVVNGYVLGFVAGKSVAQEGGLILWRLLPHGIFELPSVILSLALGLKLGMFLFVSKNKSLKEFNKWIKNSLRVFIFIILPLLGIAGIIEGILIWFVG